MTGVLPPILTADGAPRGFPPCLQRRLPESYTINFRSTDQRPNSENLTITLCSKILYQNTLLFGSHIILIHCKTVKLRSFRSLHRVVSANEHTDLGNQRISNVSRFSPRSVCVRVKNRNKLCIEDPQT